MNQSNERLYVDVSEKGFLRVTEPGTFPLYRSQDGEFEMEFTLGEGWTLYAVLPRYGRIVLGRNPYRTKLADSFGMTLEELQ